MAKENEEVKVTDKPTGTEETAPVVDETVPVTEEAPEEVETPAGETEPAPTPEPESPEEGAGEEIPTQDDFSAVIELLNEVDIMNGGNGEIGDIPPALANSVKYIADKMIALRDAFEDPYLKDVLDNMVDQREDGKTPSLLAAVAQILPIEEIQQLADSEDYESAQNGVKEGLEKQQEEQAGEAELYAKFDESKGNIEAYVSEMGYNEDEAGRLYDRIAKLRDIFADGLITKEEVAEIDKADKYDSDVAALQQQIPAEPTKEVLPDRGSMDEQVAQTQQKPSGPSAPRNSIEALQANQGGQTDVTKIGKRRFVK